MLNIGIIGPGRVAERHAIALQMIPNAQLWAIAGRTLESAKLFAENHNPKAKIFDDIEEMLEDPNLHAVIIATPDNLHAEHIILCAKAGKDILVEKPVCTSMESGQEILSTIARYPVMLSVAYHLRWHQGFRFLAKKARNGELGEIQHLQFRWGVDFIDHAKWRLDPVYGRWCCLSALGTHLIDLTRWMLLPTCGEVLKQNSQVKFYGNTAVDEAASIFWEFESGAKAEIFFSLAENEPLSLKINGNKGSVNGDNLAGPTNQRKLTINNENFIFTDTNLYFEQLKGFVDLILNNTKAEVALDEALKNVAHLLSIKN
jgi:UDP-N-acetyl-2-amino-2-deoxyglucuronate dehydrogenase